MPLDRKVAAALDAFAVQFQGQLDNAGVPSHEHAIHFCLALGFQATYEFPPGSIVFERPTGSGRIDLWIADRLDLAIEVKFHRTIPGGKNLPSTQLFGGLLADVNKVAGCSAADRLVVLVSDGPGVAYLQNNGHGLLPLSKGPPKIIGPESVELLPPTAAFQAKMDGTWISLTTELAFQRSCQDLQLKSWHLLAWHVVPNENATHDYR